MEIVSDFSPVATRNLPLGSMANPRGWRSVGVLDKYVSLPLAPSTLKAASMWPVRSEMYRNFPSGVMWISAAQMSLSVLRGGGALAAPMAPRRAPGHREGRNSPQQLAQRVQVLVVARDDEVARARHRFHQVKRRGVRAQLAGLRIEGELKDRVAAQRGDVDELVALVDADRMRVAAHGNHLQRLGGNAAVAADRVDADDVSAIGRAAQEAPGLVERDVRKALRQW